MWSQCGSWGSHRGARLERGSCSNGSRPLTAAGHQRDPGQRIAAHQLVGSGQRWWQPDYGLHDGDLRCRQWRNPGGLMLPGFALEPDVHHDRPDEWHHLLPHRLRDQH